MASIEIILRDDHGNLLNQQTQQQYHLSVGGERLSDIEAAIEEFKRESLPAMTHDLLADVQHHQTEGIKKTSRSNVMDEPR
jgi:hypothetical protein